MPGIPGSLYPKETPPLTQEELQSVRSLDIDELNDILSWSEGLDEDNKNLIQETVSGLLDIYKKNNLSTYDVRTIFTFLKTNLTKYLEENNYSKKQAA
ncbi:hypothetical protein KC852_00675 [Candidatus Nomurabacteria bacterium]|nr:hypothetical protein [Candidatus Nomurabacteria bacterium]